MLKIPLSFLGYNYYINKYKNVKNNFSKEFFRSIIVLCEKRGKR